MPSVTPGLLARLVATEIAPGANNKTIYNMESRLSRTHAVQNRYVLLSCLEYKKKRCPVSYRFSNSEDSLRNCWEPDLVASRLAHRNSQQHDLVMGLNGNKQNPSALQRPTPLSVPWSPRDPLHLVFWIVARQGTWRSLAPVSVIFTHALLSWSMASLARWRSLHKVGLATYLMSCLRPRRPRLSGL